MFFSSKKEGLLCSSDTGVRLFKRVRRGTAFAASAVNRRGQTAASPAAAKQASAGNLDDVDEEAVSLAWASTVPCNWKSGVWGVLQALN